MNSHYEHNKPLQLSKLVDGSIAKTLRIYDNDIRAIRFDHNLQLDKGLYDVTVLNNKYSTGAANVRVIAGIEGTYRYKNRENETERGIKYECEPRYIQNQEGNRKSHLVYYNSTNAIDGKRQTFNFVYSSAINAVKEILMSDYFLENYGELIPDGSTLQVRTLITRYLPTAELTESVIKGELDSDFLLTLLCVITLYYLQKTFCFDELELSEYDTNCETIINTINAAQGMLGKEEWEIYMTFLYLLSIGKTFIKSPGQDEWVLKDSSQKKFYYALDYKPIAYQNIAIGDSQLSLKSNLMKIAEDLSSILGYSSKVLALPYSNVQTSIELRNIVQYFVYPNIVNSSSFNECVQELYESLYRCKDMDKILAFEKIATDITPGDTSLVVHLAKDIIEKLYKTYPMTYFTYFNRCKNELEITKLSVPKSILSPADFLNKVVSDVYEGIQFMQIDYGEDGIVDESQFTKFGYTLQEEPALPVLKKMGYSNIDLEEECYTKPGKIYTLKNSPACFAVINNTRGVLDNSRNRTGYDVQVVSTYEILVEVIANVIKCGYAYSGVNGNKITLDNTAMMKILEEYIVTQETADNGYPTREYYLAVKVYNDLINNPTVLKVTRIVSGEVAMIDIEANLFVLNQLNTFLSDIIRKKVNNAVKEATILPNNIRDNGSVDIYKTLNEAARQLLAFFSEFTKDYSQIYTPIQNVIYSQAHEEGLPPDVFYNYEDVPMFSLSELEEKRNEYADQDRNFCTGYQTLKQYIGSNGSGIINIQECDITSHIERKLVRSTTNGSQNIYTLDLWEPHTMKLRVSIPYAEYLKLKNAGTQGLYKYTLTVDSKDQTVASWS